MGPIEWFCPDFSVKRDPRSNKIFEVSTLFFDQLILGVKNKSKEIRIFLISKSGITLFVITNSKNAFELEPHVILRR